MYLVVACEELRVFGIFERLSEKIGNFEETVPGLLSQVLQRLEQVCRFEIKTICFLLKKCKGIWRRACKKRCDAIGLRSSRIDGIRIVRVTRNTYEFMERSIFKYVLV